METFTCTHPTPLGFAQLVFGQGGRLLALRLTEQPPQGAPFAVPDIWQQQLDAYFAGSLKDFGSHPLPHGTPFQHAVWTAVMQVPYGRTATYTDIAFAVGSHPRAVGTACGKNPLSLIIPTHRIVPHGYRVGSVPPGGFMYLRDRLLVHENAR